MARGVKRGRGMRQALTILGLLPLLALASGCETAEYADETEISELVVEPVVCGLRITFHWHDDNADLSGGRYHVQSDPTLMHGDIDWRDAQDIDLELFVPVAEDQSAGGYHTGLLPGATCDVVVWVEDHDLHRSNDLSTPDIEVPGNEGCNADLRGGR